jgi:uncharacterized protein
MPHALLFPIISGFIAQLIKFLIKTNKQKASLKNLLAYSGMPSGHSAMVVSLTTIVGLELGISSPLFGVSAILAIIVIRDAMGIRQYLGQHGKTLNVLVSDLQDDNVLESKYPHLLEKIGHTPAQVLAGSIIGFLVSILGYYFFPY